jgi:hypothetical protein
VEINITFCFPPIPWGYPKRWPPWPLQDTTDRERIWSEVILLGVKLKVAISIHKFALISCIVQELIVMTAPVLQHSSKKSLFVKLAQTPKD